MSDTLPPDDVLTSSETSRAAPPDVVIATGIRIPRTAYVHDYAAGSLVLRVGEAVVVETERGDQLGYVTYAAQPRQLQEELWRVIRRAAERDLQQDQDNAKREEEAFEYCRRRIRDQRLPMKLISVERPLQGHKMVFYFSSEGRVDFRALVKDLAYTLRSRIEMRQVGVRDESKMLGGIGPCGQELCCHRFLRAFAAVSIKMAKDQGLALNPQKVSGVCGRLMCCLTYEEEAYKDLRHNLPKIGKRVMTPKGEGKVISLDIIGQRVRVATEEGVDEWPANAVYHARPGNAPPEPPPRQGNHGKPER